MAEGLRGANLPPEKAPGAPSAVFVEAVEGRIDDPGNALCVGEHHHRPSATPRRAADGRLRKQIVNFIDWQTTVSDYSIWLNLSSDGATTWRPHECATFQKPVKREDKLCWRAPAGERTV
jgi:hypothetical protein